MDNLFVCEIFNSIQGESSWAGLPCLFIRLAGCNLRCRWCDTPYAWDQGRPMSIDQLTAEAGRPGVNLVEVTGGEPLAQAGSHKLISRLCDAGKEVLVETNGSRDVSGLDQRAFIIMDIKCPSSGMSGRTLWANLERLKPEDEVKFVLGDRADYEYARDICLKYALGRSCKVLLSTVHGLLAPAKAVSWMLADGLNARFQLQLHKYIWPPDARGV